MKNKYILGLNIYHADSSACIMKNGEIVEQGKHPFLLNKDGVYKKLYEIETLKEHKGQVKLISDMLLEKETIDYKDIIGVLDKTIENSIEIVL